jgi:nucleoside-diphosphate-sugar epimerase
MNLGQEIQTVLVTGGTGFVGGAVAQRLRSENCTVRALVRRNSETAALTAAGCELWTVDITDAASVIEAMEGVDAMRKHEMDLFGSPDNTIPLCYIDNLVDAVLIALTRDEVVGQGYIVSDGAVVTWKELTDLLADRLDLPRVKRTIPLPMAKEVAAGAETLAKIRKSTKRPALTRYEIEIGGRDLRYSNAKIVRELGFSPRIPPEEGLVRTIEWLESMELSKIKTK